MMGLFTRTAPDQAFRLPKGGAIDRHAPLPFTFDGKPYVGYEGDTLASALVANGVRLVGRSFKYHRPRGIYSAGPEEPNALVGLRSGGRQEPNTRATVIELFSGLEARSQNAWPSLALDVMGLNDIASPVLVAGFYYKTFMGFPGWHFWEERIRKAAGMGSAVHIADPDVYDKMAAHCDVLIVGGGPAGLAAALTAGRAGARVILVDESDAPGGRLRSERETLDGEAATDWVAQTVAELASLPNVRLLTRTTAFGYYDGNTVGAVERLGDHLPVPAPHTARQRMWTIRARRVVIAAGATERPLVFDGNDKPGVMMAGAVRTYLNRFAAKPGQRAVVFANNDDGYRTALDMAAAGMDVRGVFDTRRRTGGAWRDKAEAAGIECRPGMAVVRTHGYLDLVGVDIAPLAEDGQTLSGDPSFISCDLVATSGGWSPNVHLHCHAGGRPVYDDAVAGFVPGTSRQAETSVGAARGRFSTTDALSDGAAAARDALEALGMAPASVDLPATEELGVSPIQAIWRVPTIGGRKGRRFVDLQDDVTASDIELAHREGYVSVEHLKRYTTLGMGTDQGKTSNMNGHAILAEERGQPIGEVGTTMFRPPYTPVPMGVLAGREQGAHLAPTRRSAMHDWHAENGAVFVEAGHWLRPQYYLKPGEKKSKRAMDRAIEEETLAVRSAVGMVDVSTLGKIDLQGPDTAEFLNRLYINGWKTLAVGKARYGIMLREDGIVFDDGTTSRLGEHHYLMTTTTAQAGRIMAHLEEYLQIHWPELKVSATSVTEQWAAMALSGPRARDVLAAAVEGADMSNEALPFMGVVEAEVAGCPVRIFRISFSGELAYEINTPADYGTDVWEALMDAGRDHGIRPYGTEALSILRIEKGHVAGPELDGRTTAADLGLGRMVSSKKPFIGSDWLGVEGRADENRPSLVGLTPVDGRTRIKAGAILVEADHKDGPTPIPKAGWVSSSAYLSPHVGQPIALGMLTGGKARLGETVWALFPLRNQAVEVRVVDPIFIDPDGSRLHD